jgi:hypothetical protein
MIISKVEPCALYDRPDLMDSADAICKRLNKNSRDELAIRSFGNLLMQGGRSEGLQRWSRDFARDQKAIGWLQEVIANALRDGFLQGAGRAAELYSLLRWGARDNADFRKSGAKPASEWPTSQFLTHSKLQHDIEQFEYLGKHEILSPDLVTDLRVRYQAADAKLHQGSGERRPLDDGDREEIGPYYNRILYLRPTPRVAKALSPSWDRARVQHTYIDASGVGVVVIDDFLTNKALEELRAFCLESTIWFANRYAHGRLGAFFHDGFTCPLLVQIAEELRQELSEIFLPRYPLTQIWAFKNTQHLPARSSTHADFAAVTTNLWITPDSANTLFDQGGLTIHNVDAPLHWDFLTYNGRSDVIFPFLDAQGAKSVTIPYRHNRAVIFNADLFHGTQEVKFKPGYENQRINVSWLYGRREDDTHHRSIHAPISRYRSVRPWRSAGLR